MLKRIISLTLLSAMLLSCAAMAEAPGYEAVYSASNPIPEIVEHVRPAVVQVNCYAENWDPLSRVVTETDTGSASGTYIRVDDERTEAHRRKAGCNSCRKARLADAAFSTRNENSFTHLRCLRLNQSSPIYNDTLLLYQTRSAAATFFCSKIRFSLGLRRFSICAIM